MIQKNLVSGAPIPEGVKVTEIRGTSDLLSYSRSFNARVEKAREGGGLASNFVPREGDESRRAGADMGHWVPYTRENEIRRWVALLKALNGIKWDYTFPGEYKTSDRFEDDPGGTAAGSTPK